MSMHVEISVVWECDNCGAELRTDDHETLPSRARVADYVDGWKWDLGEILCDECVAKREESE